MTRALGTENEFIVHDGTEYVEIPDDYRIQWKADYAAFTLIGCSSVLSDEGGRYYVDCVGTGHSARGYLEANTPECATPKELTLYDAIAQKRALEHVGGPLFRTNVAKNSRGVGHSFNSHHLNIQADMSWAHETNIKDGRYCRQDRSAILNLLLSVMTLVYGTGLIDATGKYRTSQRSGVVESSVNSYSYDQDSFLVTHTAKTINPIVFLKSLKSHDRLQFGTLDSMQSDPQKLLAYTMLSRAMDAIENSELYLSADNDEAIRVFHELPYAYADPGQFVIETSNGKMSAIDIFEHYAERLFDVSGGNDYFNFFVGRLKAGDYRALGRSIDWAIKLCKLEDARKIRGYEFSNPRMKSLDINFHRIGADSKGFGIYQKLRHKGRVDVMVTDRKIRRYSGVPPNTRARSRILAARYGLRPDFSTWNKSSTRENVLNKATVEMPDPLGNYDNDVRDVVRRRRLKRVDL